MTVVVLASASGSPGVTTTTLGLGLTWPREALVVEADPTGGSAMAAGYLRGQVAAPEGLIELALAAQDGRILDRLREVAVQLPGSTTGLVAGARSHQQSRALVGLWEPLSSVLAGLDTLGRDVLVDAGRLGLHGFAMPLLESADLALLVTRSDLVALAGARSWAQTLRDRFDQVGASASLGVLLIGENAPFTPREVASVLGLPVVAAVAWDPRSARVLSHGDDPPEASGLLRLAGRSGWDDAPLVRSLRATRSTILATIRAHERALSDTGTWGTR